MADWDAAFRMWMGNARKFAAEHKAKVVYDNEDRDVFGRIIEVDP
jgi:hypothetical protein